MESIPPSYTPSPPSPSYSTRPLPGESTVVQTHRVLAQQRIGVFRRITDNVTLVLKDQLPGSIQPTYGRDGRVRGHLMLNVSEEIRCISLRLEGHLNTQVAGTSCATTLFKETYKLWQGDLCGEDLPPSVIPFSLSFPSTFKDGDHIRALPPSYETESGSALCSYTLTVILSKQRRMLTLLKPSDNLTVGLQYIPRCRPHAPLLPSHLPFMSTVKSSPEEWHQVMTIMKTSRASGLTPVECLLFIPAVQIYALSDTIPFHLQLRGFHRSLEPFFEQSDIPSESGSTVVGVSISISLLRQTVVQAHGTKMSTSRILGEGKIRPSASSPEVSLPFQTSPLADGIGSLDWDGEIRCSEDVTVASFATSQLVVKDFIVLSLSPSQPLKCPLIAVKYHHPIRLVTDPWTDQISPW
ncbi:hypothetical protein BJ138DRAFT_1114654 [Hygrophoropsis aurantiaca]|uniref:Uncharacterized protein n=1 Tax=Hygrophoropsis aurantiaca TaxID=72124 RepID=A0ACB8A9Y0_9AGAM|nr:hypothetical protein BJ138DRAFT_1114654 [Hygrophoropsis aurantiaca]